MKRNLILIVLLAIFIFAGALGAIARGKAETECPQPEIGLTVLQNEGYGYCMLIPEAYDVSRGDAAALAVYVHSPLAVEHPVLYIDVEDAAGRSAQDAADAVTAQFTDLQNLAIGRSTVRLAGQNAVQLDGVPGQNLSRELFLVHEDRLYTLTFVPDHPDEGTRYGEMLGLYDTIVRHFTLVPSRPGAPLVTGEPCAQVHEGTALRRDEHSGYCFVHPAAYTVAQPGTTLTLLRMNPAVSDDDVQLHIHVEPARGRTTRQVADALIAQIQTHQAGYTATGPLPEIIDGVWAERLDEMPGQPPSRHLLFVHQDHLYHLTFIPDQGQSQTSTQTEMESLYEFIVNSWAFLEP